MPPSSFVRNSDVDAAHEICIVITAGQAADDHAAAAGRGGVNELTISNVNTSVGAGLTGVTAGIVEEDQIAGLQGTDAPNLGAEAALPLAGGGVRQGVTELPIDIHGEARTVKTAGRSAAVHITSAQILLGGIHDGAAAAAVAIGGQIQEIAADISFRTILAGDIIPAVLKAVDRHDGVCVHGCQNGSVGRGTGTNVDTVGVHLAVGSEHVVLVDGQVIGGDEARFAVIADAIPAGGGIVVQNGHGHALVQRSDNGGGSGGIGPHSQGGTGCGTDGNSLIGSQSGGCKQQCRDHREEQDLGCFTCEVCHGLRFLSYN